MSLDRQVSELLAALKQQGLKSFEEMTVAEARETSQAFIALQGDAEPVAKVSNRSVSVAGGEIPVRIYMPAGVGPHPVCVYFHGGGFVFGDLELIDKVARSLCNASNAAIVSVGYRKAPEYPYPTAPEDCYAALVWTSENAAGLGLDPTRIAVLGDSAGGNLAAVVTQMARDRRGPKISYQVLVYPVIDADGSYHSRTENAEGYLLTSKAMTWFFDHYLGKSSLTKEAHVSPIRGILECLPPATVITAGFDPLRDEGDAYAEALARAGVPVEHLRNPSMIHGFFWMKGVIGHTTVLFEQIGRSLGRALAARS